MGIFDFLYDNWKTVSVENRSIPILTYFFETKLVRQDVIKRCEKIAKAVHGDMNIIDLLSKFKV